MRWRPITPGGRVPRVVRTSGVVVRAGRTSAPRRRAWGSAPRVDARVAWQQDHADVVVGVSAAGVGRDRHVGLRGNKGIAGRGNLALYQLHLVMAWPMTRMTSPITRR